MSDADDLEIPEFLRRVPQPMCATEISERAREHAEMTGQTIEQVMRPLAGHQIAQRVLNGGKDPETVDIEETPMRPQDTAAASSQQKTNPVDAKKRAPRELPVEVGHADEMVPLHTCALARLVEIKERLEGDIKAVDHRKLELAAVNAEIRKRAR